MKYGVIGEKLGHSFSKEIHEQLANYQYEIHEIAPEAVDAFMKQHDFAAINVTIPYKQTVIPYLDWISDQAKSIGAVNTIVNRDGKLYGYNTDYFGMRALILRTGLSLLGKKVLILGAGGTAHTAQAVARDLGAKAVWMVSLFEGEGITYQQAYEEHADTEILINTTPCGMYPKIEGMVIDPDRFLRLEGLIDAVYNPLRTRLVSRVIRRGLPAAGGLYMLVAQAAFAVEYFLGCKVDPAEIERVFGALAAKKENIVLTGMPGSGKTTVGKRLAAQLGRSFFDTDQLIKEDTGKSPAELILENGEEVFREIECRVIRERVAPLTGSVIATGGGAVLRDENIEYLKLNGRLYFLDRPLEEITALENRPLSGSKELLKQRYVERYERYRETADRVLSPACVIEELCKEISEDLK